MPGRTFRADSKRCSTQTHRLSLHPWITECRQLQPGLAPSSLRRGLPRLPALPGPPSPPPEPPLRGGPSLPRRREPEYPGRRARSTPPSPPRPPQQRAPGPALLPPGPRGGGRDPGGAGGVSGQSPRGEGERRRKGADPAVLGRALGGSRRNRGVLGPAPSPARARRDARRRADIGNHSKRRGCFARAILPEQPSLLRAQNFPGLGALKS